MPAGAAAAVTDPTPAMIEAGVAWLRAHAADGLVSADMASGVWSAMRAARESRPVNADAIAAAEAEVRAGASISSVRRKYRLSGSVVQRLGKIRKGL